MEYEVRALGPGQVSTLLVEAVDAADARRQVAARALKPLSVQPHARSLLRRESRRASFNLILFSQELLALLDAGLTVVEALDALLEKEAHADARAILSRLLQSLQEGKSFSLALAGLPEAFPPLYASIVRAAERTGSLGEALSRYVDYQVRLDAVKSRLLTAAIYPAILLVAGTLVSFFLLGYVVPRFASVYQGSGRPLPWLSSLLVEWGTLVAHHQYGFIFGGLGTLAMIALAVRNLGPDSAVLRGLQHLPMVARQVRTFQLARLYLTIGMLLDGGLPIVQALSLVGELLAPAMRQRLDAATLAIQRGETISQALDGHGLTTPVGVRMLRVGEQSGSMGPMMGRIARIYDTEVSRAIERLTRIIEPVLMATIGIVVGGIVVLLYLPIFDLAGSLQ